KIDKENQDKKRILTVGTAIVKNIDGLIEDFLEIDREDIELYIIGGENENIRKIKSKYANNKNICRVKFTGALSHKEVLEHYRNADIYVQASIWDAYPIAVLEALAFGLPVIITDRVGTYSIIDNGTNGLVVKHDEKGAIRKAIETLLDSEELRNKIGKNGYELAKRESWDNIGKEYKKIYEQLLKEQHQE
ncbi:MAG: glycosyltransferase family 4 protein, partial [Thermoplasmata archaeon]